MKRQVLFLCTGNSCRSQMAEAIVNARLGAHWEAFSAGTRPAGYVHPLALRALAEIGIVHAGRSKHADELRAVPFDLVVTVCDSAAEDCPVWLGQGKRVHLGFPDPAAAVGSAEEVMAVFRSGARRDRGQSTGAVAAPRPGPCHYARRRRSARADPLGPRRRTGRDHPARRAHHIVGAGRRRGTAVPQPHVGLQPRHRNPRRGARDLPAVCRPGPAAQTRLCPPLPWTFAGAAATADGAAATFRLRDSEASRRIWAHTFLAELTVSIGGDRLAVTLAVTNTGAEALTFTAALHTYLAVADIAATAVTGLAGVRYRDSAAAGVEGIDAGPQVRFAGEVDRIYFDAPSELRVIEPGAPRPSARPAFPTRWCGIRARPRVRRWPIWNRTAAGDSCALRPQPSPRRCTWRRANAGSALRR